MKRTLLSLTLCIVAAMTMAVTCEPPVVPDYSDYNFTLGAYFLNGGNPGEDDAELTQLNTVYSIVNQRIFAVANDDAKLGDNGTDMLALGSRLYVALPGSKKIAVINKYSCKSEGTVTIRSEEGATLSPSRLASFDGILICTCDEGYVASIDTTSLKAGLIQELDGIPGDICIANQKLFISSFRPRVLVDNAYGNVVYMLNPVDLNVMKEIEVQRGPREMVVDPETDGVFVLCEGATGGAVVMHIDSDSEDVKTIRGIEKPLFMAAGFEKTVIVCCESRDDFSPKEFIKIDAQSLKENGSFISDGSYLMNPSAIFVDQNTSNVYIAESQSHQNGMIYVYTSFGQYITSFNTGSPNPCAAAFVTSKN